ncbi:Transcription elongation factor Spt5 [Candidatus Anstonella stagnisolia]|nr:Transcription elongation factor Spt5 [Candidatus Anstonella stagnisolia]
MIFVYKVTAGQERVVIEMLSKKIHKENLPIFAIAHFEDLRGYIIAEAESEVAIRQAGLRIPHIKGVLAKQMDVSEIDNLVQAVKPALANISKGDIVELTSGPFKGERARVLKMDENKEELTVELTDAAVPIPVTIKSSIIKLYQKAEDQ